MTNSVSLHVSEELTARLRAESQVIDLPAPALAASLLDEGLKARRYPGIVYRDGPAGRRAGLAGGPDVWQVVRALNEAPAWDPDPAGTVSIEADLHPREIDLAVRFYEAYPGEIDEMLAANRDAAELADKMIAERERAVAEGRSGRERPTAERNNPPGVGL